ncbi:DinB family protein [Marinobacter nanhaiticus D15-8W]|uniref:Damage-inducible protein DinB n=1 Tax=Marinobacter nanhaiticus D15-8W TaxID=626887 RepID=N6W0M0_9GAMM|nr:DinB family protein [Marinobacter nanhaiticus]ENO16085.1 damage-inducible protein DinB [Marinobacter nanhaiticus D15-8W]BES73058.1 DinB family protein [Marinobacter nanhaiticus D15-8W]
MSLKQQFALMADYNAWMNIELYTHASKLVPETRRQDMGAFFGSIESTLNHILVADIVWLRRFESHPSAFATLKNLSDFPHPESLGRLLFDEFTLLHESRKNMDALLIRFIEETDEQDYDVPLHYRNSKGMPFTKPFGPLLMHLFNHQTHHRGQASALFNQLGVDIGVTDLLPRIPDQLKAM